MEFEQAITLGSLLSVVVLSWLTHRSFPPKQTAELIDRLATHAEKTQNKIDDVLVMVARLLNDVREDQVEAVPDSTQSNTTDIRTS